MSARRRTFNFNGLGVSAGVILGTAYVIESPGAETELRAVPKAEIEPEVERFRRAIALAVEEVQSLGDTVRERVDEKQAAIFEAHAVLIQDPLLIDRTIDVIRLEHQNAEYVFWNVVKDVSDRLKAIGDSYFSERSHDLFDVARRVLKFMGELKGPTESIPPGSIIVANDLGPSDTAQLQKDRIAGFCTNTGGTTSHTAIMAKALSIPAVVGLDFITHYVRTGDYLILDGTDGKVILNPDEDTICAYKDRALAFEETRRSLAQIAELPSVTLDGTYINLEANIELTEELDQVLAQGAEGIGLYRTEYFFIERPTLPTEEEQEKAYRHVLDTLAEKPVVFRTLDVGGDKLASSLATPAEANPFLGLRAIRLCLAYPDLFRTQLRPLLKAGGGRVLHVMLPLVSCVEEIWKARSIIDGVVDDLKQEGHELPTQLKVGTMIEIPSAALMAEQLAQEVDFFSIGTNDLIQYTLAVDRVNKTVGHLYKELHPAVLKLIKHVVDVANGQQLPLTICGEMAGSPKVALLLIGMGVRTLSMSPGLIAAVKSAVRGSDINALQQMAERLLKLNTAEEVRSALTEFINAQPSTLTSS